MSDKTARTLRIGTRGSALALAQAHMVRALLVEQHDLEEQAIEIVPISTTGDVVQDRPLSEIGGKGLFTKEIELALAEGQIDLAVHSMKDVPSVLPDGLVIETILEREDPRDAFICHEVKTLGDLEPGSVVGTSSLRRRAQVKRLRPDLEVVDFRGNVDTRLRKIDDEVVAATFLACAGLKRLGLETKITSVVEVAEMLPAIAQGAIGLETRQGDDRVRELVISLNDQTSAICVDVERSFLAALDGSCRTPIAGLANLTQGRVDFTGMIISTDGSVVHDIAVSAVASDAISMGRAAGLELKARGGEKFFADW